MEKKCGFPLVIVWDRFVKNCFELLEDIFGSHEVAALPWRVSFSWFIVDAWNRLLKEMKKIRKTKQSKKKTKTNKQFLCQLKIQLRKTRKPQTGRNLLFFNWILNVSQLKGTMNWEITKSSVCLTTCKIEKLTLEHFSFHLTHPSVLLLLQLTPIKSKTAAVTRKFCFNQIFQKLFFKVFRLFLGNKCTQCTHTANVRDSWSWPLYNCCGLPFPENKLQKTARFTMLIGEEGSRISLFCRRGGLQSFLKSETQNTSSRF